MAVIPSKRFKVRARHDCAGTAFSVTLGMSAVCGMWPVNAADATENFVVARLTPAFYSEDGNQCPEGLTKGLDSKAILGKLPQAQRVRLLQPENKFALVQVLCSTGTPADQPQQQRQQPGPQFRIVKGKVAHGFDLNETVGASLPAYSCPHENFSGLNGEPGVDNQWYRAMGCVEAFQPGRALYEYFNTSIRQGELSILIRVDGVDDWNDDEEVWVGFYRVAKPQPNAPKANLEVHYDEHFHAFARGSIANKVLTTEPVDMRFKATPEMRELVIRDARIRMELQPAGGLKGLLGGYQNLDVLSKVNRNFALSPPIPESPLICPDFTRVLQKLADGYPDPKVGGPCGWISTAYEVAAVPATVVAPKDDRLARMKESDSWWKTLRRR